MSELLWCRNPWNHWPSFEAGCTAAYSLETSAWEGSHRHGTRYPSFLSYQVRAASITRFYHRGFLRLHAFAFSHVPILAPRTLVVALQGAESKSGVHWGSDQHCSPPHHVS